MLADLQLELGSDVPVARIVGELDASNAAGFTARLKESVPNSAIGLVLDLSATSYLDSSGVHLIFDLAGALRRRQQVLQLVVPPDTFIADVLGAVNFRGTARASPTVIQATEAVRTADF
jgi:anti-sigma B factor antagonist